MCSSVIYPVWISQVTRVVELCLESAGLFHLCRGNSHISSRRAHCDQDLPLEPDRERKMTKVTGPYKNQRRKTKVQRPKYKDQSSLCYLPIHTVPGWRNGRRCGLKIRCPQGRAGSTPALGTTTESNSYGQQVNDH